MRREFPKAVKVAVVKRCTRDGVVYCESCQLPAKKWQIDHVRADGLLGEPIIGNAELICDVCYGIKNPQDTAKIAKAKRREAKQLGIRNPPKLQGQPFPKIVREKRGVDKSSLPELPRRNIYTRQPFE
jgi:5-methylcytosine-specific restriction enzyme A